MKGQAGYSLLEVLIAFVIMTVVLSTLIPGQANLLKRAVTLEERILAHDFALSRADALGADADLRIGETDEPYRKWRVLTSITASEQILEDAQLLAVSIEIWDQSDNCLALFETLLVAR